jgi:hypothetical protein
MTFTFSSEQDENLKRWSQYLETDESRNWQSDVSRAVIEYNRILQDAGFPTGADLTANQMDALFRNMKRLSHNRALNSLLYTDNTLQVFNQALRTLLFGAEPLPKRVDQFLDLSGMGEVTMSQFLCLHRPTDYPFYSSQTYDMLGIDATQEQQALHDALADNGLSDPNQLNHQRTAAYLQHMVVFRAVKQKLGLANYYFVNEFLWNAFDQSGSEEPHYENLTSVSIERDLRDYLAKNPFVIGKGLEAVSHEGVVTEYPTDVGRIDILCKDSRGRFVVIETKKERDSDKVIGQTARYMGWVSKNMRGPCRAVIVVGKRDERLEYAVLPFQDKVQLKYYQVRFDISDNPTEQQSLEDN